MNLGIQFFAYLNFVWDSIRANKIRSFLTTLGILIGVTTIILIFTLIQSINKYVEGELSGIGSTTIYVSKFPWIIKGNFYEYRNRPQVTLREYQVLRNQSLYARWISPVMDGSKNIKYENRYIEDVYTVGSNIDFYQTNNVDIEFGRWFIHSDILSARPVCIIGQEIWRKLFNETNPLGKRIKIDGYPYKVIGVLEKKGDFFGFNLDNQVILPYTAFRGVALNRRGIAVALKVEDPQLLDELKDETRGILRTARKIPPKEQDNFAINQQDMLSNFYTQITGTSYLVIFLIAGISLVVGGIGIMNIMLVSVSERTKEIGIRKAMGATRNQILFHFLTEALMISSIGGVLGIILGILFSQIPLNMLNLQSSVSFITIFIGFGFSSFVGIISGIYPAHKAANLNPIDALRWE